MVSAREVPMADETQTQLDFVYQHERTRGGEVWMSQPLGGGAMRDYTWSQGLGEARRVAAHLVALKLPAGSRIAIFSKNTAWWFLADLAIWMAGHVSVPVYPTLNAASIKRILDHAEAQAVFVGKLDEFTLMEPGLGALPRILLPLTPPGQPGRSWDEIVAGTPPLEGNPRRGADELATIIYTSGSTGEPKGAMHSFRTMCAARVFVDALSMAPSDRMISYLPLAHVAERACLQTTNFLAGYRVFFAESLDTFIRDVQRARPTLFGSVPRLWQKFQGGVSAKLPPKKLALLLRIPLVRGLIRKKVLKGLGLDQSRAFITGSAPTPPELLHWYGALGAELGEVYGMTENFAVSHYTPVGAARAGTAGKTAPGVTMRISEAGEVQVKSPGLMLGYYKNEALTRETIDEEGFLHTGDRGAVDADGYLRITGRLKEIFKTSKGKYVAPAPIESALLAHPHVDQAMVSGADLPQPFALVVLSPEHRAQLAGARADLSQALEQHLDATNAGLDQHERLDKLIVVGEEWTTANGLLTPTLKVKRGAVEERYAARVQAWCAQSGRVVWGESAG
jgi:long-subunit acyl-CoA synthetase (AMP-forming)